MWIVVTASMPVEQYHVSNSKREVLAQEHQLYPAPTLTQGRRVDHFQLLCTNFPTAFAGNTASVRGASPFLSGAPRRD